MCQSKVHVRSRLIIRSLSTDVLDFTGVEVVVVGRRGVRPEVVVGGEGRWDRVGSRGAVRRDQGPRGRVLRQGQGVGQVRGGRRQAAALRRLLDLG